MGTLRFFKMHLRVPFLLLALIEFCVCIAAVHVAVYVRYESWPSEVRDIQSPYVSAVLFATVMPIAMMAMGLYQSRFRGGVLGVFLRSVKSKKAPSRPCLAANVPEPVLSGARDAP